MTPEASHALNTNHQTPAEALAISSAILTAPRKSSAPAKTVLARRSCFQVTMDDGPQALLRLLGLFAARDIVPAVVRATSEQGGCHVEIMADGVDDATAAVIAEKTRMMVGVRECVLSRFARV